MTEHPTAPPDIQFRQRLSKNIVLNAVYFVFHFIIGICLVPFFLDTLGPASYGLIPLATSITSYVVMVIDAVNASISRFLSIDLQKGDYRQANKTYNTARFGIIALIIIALPIAVVIALAAPHIVNIGTETYFAVASLLLLTFLSALIHALTAPFHAVFVAYNRIDYKNYVEITNLLTQLAVMLCLFFFIRPSLVFVGISYIAAAVITVILGYLLFRKTAPFLKLKKDDISFSLLRPIADQGFWSLFYSIGILLQYPLCLIIANLVCGAIGGTEFSFGVTVCTTILSVGMLITSTFRPRIYQYRAQEDPKSILYFGKSAIKLVGLIMALPVALICVFMPQVLTIWLGEEYAYLWPFIVLMTIPMLSYITASCIGPVNAAYLKVRPVALTTFIFGIAALILALILPAVFDIGIYGIGIACAVSVFGVHGIFETWYNAHIIKAHPLSFFKSKLWSWGALIAVGLLAIIYQAVFPVNSLLTLIVACLIISGIYLICMIRIALQKEERELLRELLPGFMQKIMPKWLLR